MPRKRKTSGPTSKSERPKRLKTQKKRVGEEEEPILIPESSQSSRSASPTKNPKSTGEPVQNAEEQVSISESSSTKEPKSTATSADDEDSRFIGEPVPNAEARQRWPHRYIAKEKKKEKVTQESKSMRRKRDETEEEVVIKVRRHYTEAQIDGHIHFNLDDCAYVQGEEGKADYIGKIVEMFEAVDGSLYFTAQWFYRAVDTVIRDHSGLIDDKRVFLSEMKDDNPLDCLVKKLKIIRLPLDMDSDSRKSAVVVSKCDYYYDMIYLLPFNSFVNLPPVNSVHGSESDSTISREVDASRVAGRPKSDYEEVSLVKERTTSEMTLLDIYSGCGAMSTGLCLGANLGGVNLVTGWAVDLNEHACLSLKLNHPETEVRTESAENFFNLMQEWEKLCISYNLIGSGDSSEDIVINGAGDDGDDSEDVDVEDEKSDPERYEVEKVLGICYGDPNETKKPELHFKIRWKGYDSDWDTWEPMETLSDCPLRIREFVTNGYYSKILPLPGNVDVICGGPPCQGISGFNRFRDKKNPLKDPKNQQLAVFMDIVNFLKPRFVLMENVVDIVRFADGYLGRYALGRLVGINYQARMGMIAAGSFGLPQFRRRMFMWGARSTEKLPQYPLPTHNVVVKGHLPAEFEPCTVAHEEGCCVELEKELLLGDAISDLPPVENGEERDEMPYGVEPETEFQRFIRLRKDDMGVAHPNHVLFDHRPLQLNEDDYNRVCQIPMKKGANFRDLKGVRVREDNKVELDPDCKREYLPSGKPLVPDYAITFVRGTSTKPFGRLWWDEIVATVVTRAEPHNQTILHPKQNRVLTVRENARLQGFPDYYRLLGPVKERYIQVGNAVAVPVARALGYALALASKGSCGDVPLLTLPNKFPNLILDAPSPDSVEVDDQ